MLISHMIDSSYDAMSGSQSSLDMRDPFQRFSRGDGVWQGTECRRV